MCRETQWVHTGGWALESYSNNDLNPPLPDSVDTKRDASYQGGFGDFYFYKMMLRADGMALKMQRIRRK